MGKQPYIKGTDTGEPAEKAQEEGKEGEGPKIGGLAMEGNPLVGARQTDRGAAAGAPDYSQKRGKDVAGSEHTSGVGADSQRGGGTSGV